MIQLSKKNFSYLDLFKLVKWLLIVPPKAHAYITLPLESSNLFIPQIFIMKKAVFDFKARLSFSYLSLLIRGSIKARLFIYLAFILLIWCDVNHETSRYCVLLGLIGYYVYMLRNVKFNLLTWLYTLTSLFLALSIIITFWYIVRFLFPVLLPYLIVTGDSFLEGYKLSMDPVGGGTDGSGGAAGGPGGACGSGPGVPDGPGGSGGATGSADLGGSSDEDNNSNSDSDDTSSNDSSQLDREEHVPLPPLTGINYQVYGTNSSGIFQGLLNSLDVHHENKNATQLLGNYTNSKDQLDYVNSVDPNGLNHALNDVGRNAQLVNDKCAEYIEDLTGIDIRDGNEFDNMSNTNHEMAANGADLDQMNQAINKNNDND